MNYKEFIARVDDLTRKVIGVTSSICVTYDNLEVPCREVANVDEVSMKKALEEIRTRIRESYHLFGSFASFMAVPLEPEREEEEDTAFFESFICDISKYVDKFLDTSREVVSNITGTGITVGGQEDEVKRTFSYEDKLETIVNCLNSVLDNLYEINYFLNATETVEDSDCDVTEKDTLVDLTPSVDDSNTKASDDNSTINLTE